MRRWRPFAVAALLVRAAAAESRTLPEAVELVLPTCAPELFDPAGLVSFATVELRAAGVSSVGVADPPGVSSPRIVVACDASVTQVGLDVVRPGASDHRTLDLSDVPRELRARTIAIAMVELLRSGSGRSDVPNAGTPAMVESTAPTLPPALPAPPPQQDVAVAREGDRKAPARSGHMTGHIEAAAAVFDFPDRGTALVGPIAAFALDVGRLRASAGALFTFGQVEAATGVAETRWASGYAAVGYAGAGALRPLIEPRFYAGYAWASGVPSSARTEGNGAGHSVIALALAAGLRGSLAERWEMLADLEIGYTLTGITFLSDAESVGGVSRTLLGARVGVAFAP